MRSGKPEDLYDTKKTGCRCSGNLVWRVSLMPVVAAAAPKAEAMASAAKACRRGNWSAPWRRWRVGEAHGVGFVLELFERSGVTWRNTGRWLLLGCRY